MASKLKELLKERGLTQKKFADMIGKSEISVSKYVNGDKPSIQTEKK